MVLAMAGIAPAGGTVALADEVEEIELARTTAEETTTTESTTAASGTSPRTSDSARLALWVLLMAFAACGISGVCVWNVHVKRKNKR